ncbi:MAG: phosphomannomutase/phosphoglucomutase [Gammaproteobacteria bacterium]|jgi:phosphomannomutase/phosphoglucomutase
MIKLPPLPELPAGVLKPKIIFSVLGIIAAVVVFLAISTVQENLAEAELGELLDENQRQVETLARQLGAVFEPQRLKLKSLAQKPSVVAALSAAKSTRDAVAALEQAEIPNALRLRMLPPGADHIDPNSTPPLTFASVDMLQSAGQRESDVDIELHLSGTPNEHLVLIQRVPLAGPLVGFLHLSLDASLIRQALSNISLAPGAIEVRQPVPKAPPVVLAKAGSAGKNAVAASIAGIAGTKWVVSYSTGGTGSAASGLGQILSIAMGLIVLAVLAFVGFTLVRTRMNKSRSSSGITYQGAIKAIMEGSLPGLEKLLPGAVGVAPPFAAQDSGVSQGLEGEDITTFSTPPPAVAHDTTIPGAFDITEPDLDLSAIEINEEPVTTPAPAQIDPRIFRNYDIRGVVGESLSVEAVYDIGRALGSEAAARGQQTVITARDGRNSSQELRDALIEGLRDSGRDVLDIGLTPTPVLYFATHYLDTHSGVMITGSHNPPEYNGLKIVLDGESLSGDAIQAIRQRIEDKDFVNGEGTMQTTEIIPDYIRRISEEIPVTLGNALKVVVDCGNSVPGIVAPHILRAIGHDVIELYCDIDGNFPNHHPDPSQEVNLQDLIKTVLEEEADVGLAFDGDGDRLGVVDSQGNIIWPDKQMMLFSRDVLSRNPGAKIVYDVKCSKLLSDDIKSNGGEPIMAKTGRTLIKTTMEETGALLGGEMSGHIFFKERWYGFDDALYSAARLLEILVNAQDSPDEVFAALPGGIVTPELRLDMPEEQHADFMQKILEEANFSGAEITTIDGLRVDFDDGWGLIRASNTTPCLVLRFEGNDEAALEAVKNKFRALLLKLDSSLDLPF